MEHAAALRLFEQHEAWARTWAKRFCGRWRLPADLWDDAENVALLVMWRTAFTFDPTKAVHVEPNFRGYVFRTIRGAIWQMVLRYRRQGRHFLQLEHASMISIDLHFDDDPDKGRVVEPTRDDSPPPAPDLREVVVRLIARLKGDDRRVVELLYSLGSVAAVAKELGVCPQRVYQRLERVRRQQLTNSAGNGYRRDLNLVSV